MRQVSKYSEAIKASVLSKALTPNAQSVIELSKEFNIPKGTIYRWIENMGNKNTNKGQTEHRPKDRTAEFKLEAIIDTLGKTEEEQSAYCRTNGIYYNHLEEWKQQVLESLGAVARTTNKDTKNKEKENKAESQRMQAKMKQLESDLKRKEKALAELSALLVLKKKADLLWGGNEDD